MVGRDQDRRVGVVGGDTAYGVVEDGHVPDGLRMVGRVHVHREVRGREIGDINGPLLH